MSDTKKRTFAVWIFGPGLRRAMGRIEGYRRLAHDKPAEWKSYVPATLILDPPKRKPSKRSPR